MITLIVNTTEHLDPGTVTVAADDDLIIEWDPISAEGGIGREAIGQERAGFSAGIPGDLFYTTIEVCDANGELIVESDPILPLYNRFHYTREDNKADHGTYETDNIFKIIQVARDGTRSELGRVVTT